MAKRRKMPGRGSNKRYDGSGKRILNAPIATTHQGRVTKKVEKVPLRSTQLSVDEENKVHVVIKE